MTQKHITVILNCTYNKERKKLRTGNNEQKKERAAK